MLSRRRLSCLIVIVSVSICVVAIHSRAQVNAHASPATLSPQTPSTQRVEQEPIKVFTEEVRIPVVAYDDYGHYDPTLEPDDILVLEDGLPQQIRSVRRLPADVLLVLDMSSQITLAKSSDTTRGIALRLISSLRAGDQVSAIQFSDRVELLHDWTTDLKEVEHALKTKLYSSKRARLSEAIVAAVAQFKNRPLGNRHLVLITDGVETPGGKVSPADAFKQLSAAQASVHVISYTALIRRAIDQRYKRSIYKQGGSGAQRDATPGGDPTLPPGMTRNPTFTLGTIDLDRQMRRWYKKYAEATEQSERRLASLAEETGGRLLLPETTEEMIRQGNEVARDIGAQYVVTYAPKRPLVTAKAGEYRRLEVAPRRSGLSLRSRRGYIAVPTP